MCYFRGLNYVIGEITLQTSATKSCAILDRTCERVFYSIMTFLMVFSCF